MFVSEYDIDPVKIPVEKQMLNFANYSGIFPEISRIIWQYFGYSGQITPWHDNIPVVYFPSFVNYLQKSIASLVENDISIYSFGYLTLPFHEVSDWERPTLLFGAKVHISWAKRLRKFIGSREGMDYLADFMISYYQTCVQYFGNATLEKGQIIKKRESSYVYEGYERLWGRILEITSEGADPIMWMQQKVDKFSKCYPKDRINFNCLVNKNGLDPNLEDLQKRVGDPWVEIKDFLGLSIDCEIVDGYIPKGWQTSGEDFEDRRRIVRITGDGFYYYENNSQRRGKRHYAGNTNYGIKCDPSNFAVFKDSWLDESLLMVAPTWEEYSKWAIYPDIWGEDGVSKNGRGRSIKWRRK